jgi:hypothetical protein
MRILSLSVISWKDLVTTKFIIPLLLLSGCTTTVINHPSVCPGGDKKCQRNLDAQTLSVIGQGEAALKLMCLDADLFDVLDEKCKK